MNETIIINILSSFLLLCTTLFLPIKLCTAAKEKRKLMDSVEEKIGVQLRTFNFGIIVGIIGMLVCFVVSIRFGVYNGIMQNSFTDLFLGIMWGSLSLIWIILIIVLSIIFRYTWITEKGIILTEEGSTSMYSPEFYTWSVKNSTLKLRNKLNGKKKSYHITGDVNEAISLLSKYYEEEKI